MNAPTVVVVGSINTDDAIRLARLPGPGETVGARSLDTALGGKGANQAIAAARAGARVRMIGAVGEDGDALIRALSADAIDTSGIAVLTGWASGRAVVLVGDDGENSIVVVPGANQAVSSATVEAECARMLPGDILLLQHEVPIGTSRAAARAARTAGATVIWNAAPAPTDAADLLLEVDVLVVNEHELADVATLLGIPAAHDDVPVMMAHVADRTGADVVCTLGAGGGAYLVDGVFGAAPARQVNAVDTTAAGDTFVGYLAATAGLPFADRLRTALAAGSLTVTKPGASGSIPSRKEVDATLRSRSTTATTERTPV